MEISSIRKDYRLKSLDEAGVDRSPIGQFECWFKEALDAKVIEVNAMVLSTSTLEGRPSARVVLLKGFDGQGFVFYTNYESRKGHELLVNPNACLTFFWPELERQVRIEGLIERATEEEAISYFRSRPFESKVGAWVSPQSQVVANREFLEQSYEQQLKTFNQEGTVPKPDYWGGYRLKPSYVEFWQGRANRLHDRIVYIKEEAGWRIERLAP